LVAQGSLLGEEICTILENGGSDGENQWQLERHLADCSLSSSDQKTSAIPLSYPIMTKDNAETQLKIPILQRFFSKRLIAFARYASCA
jgi:hypothetical protein